MYLYHISVNLSLFILNACSDQTNSSLILEQQTVLRIEFIYSGT